MRAKQLLMIAVVSTLLIGGVAALGAASPADQANASGTDAPESGQGNASDAADSAAEDRAGNADGVGPSDGLPEQVPAHVSGIHDRIDSFQNGSIDNLGESLSEFLGDGAAADDEADNASDGSDA